MISYILDREERSRHAIMWHSISHHPWEGIDLRLSFESLTWPTANTLFCFETITRYPAPISNHIHIISYHWYQIIESYQSYSIHLSYHYHCRAISYFSYHKNIIIIIIIIIWIIWIWIISNHIVSFIVSFIMSVVHIPFFLTSRLETLRCP